MCLHTKKLFLSFSVRKNDDIFNAFLVPSNKFSYMTPTGVHSFFSLHSQIKKFVRLTMAERKGLFLFIPGRIDKNQNIFRSISEALLSSGRSFFSICILYLLLYGQSKNTWTKDSDWIGLGSFPAKQRLHSALIPGTNLHTLEFKPRVLFLNLNKNSRHLLLKYPLFHSPHQNLIIDISGLVTPVMSKNVFAVFKFSIFQRCISFVCKIRLNG
jgi:hypothetical protein